MLKAAAMTPERRAEIAKKREPYKAAPDEGGAMPEFPKRLASVGTILGQRNLYSGPSVTEILALDSQGSRTTQWNRNASFGLYTWDGAGWELYEVYRTVREARNAAARIRKEIVSRPNSN